MLSHLQVNMWVVQRTCYQITRNDAQITERVSVEVPCLLWIIYTLSIIVSDRFLVLVDQTAELVTSFFITGKASGNSTLLLQYAQGEHPLAIVVSIVKIFTIPCNSVMTLELA